MRTHENAQNVTVKCYNKFPRELLRFRSGNLVAGRWEASQITEHAFVAEPVKHLHRTQLRLRSEYTDRIRQLSKEDAEKSDDRAALCENCLGG
jgi:hypothetical protein